MLTLGLFIRSLWICSVVINTQIEVSQNDLKLFSVMAYIVRLPIQADEEVDTAELTTSYSIR